jgi:hypothetical protein
MTLSYELFGFKKKGGRSTVTNGVVAPPRLFGRCVNNDFPKPLNLPQNDGGATGQAR